MTIVTESFRGRNLPKPNPREGEMVTSVVSRVMAVSKWEPIPGEGMATQQGMPDIIQVSSHEAAIPAYEIFTRKEINRLDFTTDQADSPNKYKISSRGR